MVARLGCLSILKQLVKRGCQVNARTETSDIALMLVAKADQVDCFLELIISSSDLGLIHYNGESVVQLENNNVFGSSMTDIFRRAINIGKKNLLHKS